MATTPHPDLERENALSDIDYHEAEGLNVTPDAEKANVRHEWRMVGAALSALSLLLLTVFALATRHSGDTTTIVKRTVAAPAAAAVPATAPTLADAKGIAF